MTEKGILERVQNLQDAADSNDESDNGISFFNDAVPMPSISEVLKIINSMLCYLDVHSNGDMNKMI